MDVMNMRATIIVEEEYGYRYWVWKVNTKTIESLQGYYNSIVQKKNFFCRGLPEEHLIGEWEEVEWEEWREIQLDGKYDGYAHIHQDDDSHIRFGEL